MQNNLEIEMEKQKEIFKNIDDFSSFRLVAGAGSGKTYALIESIKYLLNNKINVLKRNNQKILCITYTNVAVNEINNRLGQSDVVLVSTIHERLWETVKNYQSELIEIHKNKINKEIVSIDDKLNNENISDFQRFRLLNAEEKEKFICFIVDKKDFFFKYDRLTASEFKEAFLQLSKEEGIYFLSDLLKNVALFKKLVKSIFKKINLETCLEGINSKKNKKIEYDSNSNLDKLHRMKFSHDTLLEYSFSLIETYPILRRIIIDKFPYVFVDEFQDTNELVIKLFNCLDLYSKLIKKEWLVGYFGDTVQNIYNDGVGENIVFLHPNIKVIDKKINRRSEVQVVDLINRIRNDSFNQIPIFDNRYFGSVEFFYKKNDGDFSNKLLNVNDFLKYFSSTLKEDNNLENSTINCLVATNKMVAYLNGFGSLYEKISKSKKIFHNEINISFLSKDLRKLNENILLFYKLLSLYSFLFEVDATFSNIYGSKGVSVTLGEGSIMIKKLKGLHVNNLNDFIIGINALCNDKENLALKRCLKFNLDFELKEKNDLIFFNFFQNNIFDLLFDKSPSNDETELQAANDLLNIDIEEWLNWFYFVSNKKNKDINFHTYHGTKGEQYMNVAIILENDFGSSKNKFKDYFNFLQLNDDKNSCIINSADIKNTRNLLYVACSRAIKNLKIFYLNDIGDIKDGVRSVFLNLKEWNEIN